MSELVRSKHREVEEMFSAAIKRLLYGNSVQIGRRRNLSICNASTDKASTNQLKITF